MTRDMKKAVMYGAGNIGRGFIGQLFSLSGYYTRFIDINMTLIDRLNADGSYPHYITAGDHYERSVIENVCGVDGKDVAAVAEAIAEADVMATAIGVNVLKFIAGPIAAGLSLRRKRGAAPLNILICENMIGSDEFLRGLVYEHLSPEEREWAADSVGFVEASIQRMVPAVPAELAAENPLAVCVEPFAKLPVDKAAFRGEIPYIIGMEPFSPFVFFIERKLLLMNMEHAMTAYLGALCGDADLWRSALRPEIKVLVMLAAQESALALSGEHGVDVAELLDCGMSFLVRLENRLLGDTVARVGRDTKRKLGANDRMVGAYRLCRRHGLSGEPAALGIAAGLRFAGTDDASSLEVSECARTQGAAAALAAYCGVTDPEDVARISKYYDLLAGHTLTEIATEVLTASTGR